MFRPFCSSCHMKSLSVASACQYPLDELKRVETKTKLYCISYFSKNYHFKQGFNLWSEGSIYFCLYIILFLYFFIFFMANFMWILSSKKLVRLKTWLIILSIPGYPLFIIISGSRTIYCIRSGSKTLWKSWTLVREDAVSGKKECSRCAVYSWSKMPNQGHKQVV